MSVRTVELVSEWDSVPFDGGYDGLRSLSDRGFSGAVTAGSTRLLMLKGTAVAILDGDIEDYDGADGTARAAPHDALPLLVAMQANADSPRAEYYTEDTSISEVDQTLKDGNFTGFLELSENVLSGDYYLVYHQGRSMTVGWVGNAQRLVTDEEAFEQADGEVGIYQVMPADIEPIEIPAPPEPSSTTDENGASAPAETTATDETDPSGTTTSDQPPADKVQETATGARSGTNGESDTTARGSSERKEAPDHGAVSTAEPDTSDRGASSGPPGSKAAGASQGTAVDRRQRDEANDGVTDSAPADDSATTQTESQSASERGAPNMSESEPAEQPPSEPETTPGKPESGANEGAITKPSETEARTNSRDSDAEMAAREAQAATAEEVEESQTAAQATDSDVVSELETRSIPSLDPELSSTPASANTTTQTTPQQSSTTPSEKAQPMAPETETATTRESPADTTDEPQSDAPTASDGTQQTQRSELAAELEERNSEIAALEKEIETLSTENEELAAERDQLVEDLEAARNEIQRLEEELDAAGGAVPSGEARSKTEAISGTDLFVRYNSKGDATLAKAQSGNANKAAVEENIRLEHHTQFDSENTVVDGDPFEEFLRGSIQYRFVEWLVRSLLYEIRETGHESTMSELYDALPEIDRAELNGTVSVTYTEEGQEQRSQETFDVVVRDRLGNPLVVANINQTRQPATDGQMTNLVRDAERVGNTSDSLAAAFLVTSSFFEPKALETAREATSSGLLSRDKRKSFVNLSRKDGYHLCLLEARNNDFHLAVPEL